MTLTLCCSYRSLTSKNSQGQWYVQDQPFILARWGSRWGVAHDTPSKPGAYSVEIHGQKMLRRFPDTTFDEIIQWLDQTGLRGRALITQAEHG